MTRYMAVAGMVVLLGGIGALPAVAQPWRGRGFDPGRGPMELTPEQLDELYDRVAERQLERFTDDYVLTPEQQEQVQARLEELKDAQRAYSAPRREEFQRLREELFEAFGDRRDGKPVDEQRLNDARERLHDLFEGSPLMNPDRAAEMIEPLLPAEQVEKGRQRRAERHAERERRHNEWRQRMEAGGGPDGRRGFGRGDSWRRYVDDFIERYDLTESQQLMAESILHELEQKRDTYRDAYREEFDRVRQLDDRQARREAYEKLNAPVDQLYQQLKDRLARIPTSRQVRAAQQAEPTSQPAGATSRPAGRSAQAR